MCQVESLKTTLNKQQYSTVNNNLNYSTVQYSEIKLSLSDVIPDDGYDPFYERQLKQLGGKRFVELANKARAGSDTPARLFCWMLKHQELVR